MKPQIRDKEFESAAKRMISEKKHAVYMQHALEDYHAYLRFMTGAFLEEPNEVRFIVRATYRLKKGLWREIEINGRQTLADLASCIIESMDWVEDHLHGFWFPDERRNRIFGSYGMFHEEMEDDPHPTFKTKDVPISQVDWEKYPVLGFVFDFGDSHEFDIALKQSCTEASNTKRRPLPLLIDQRGVAPEQYPEDDEE